MDSQLSRRPHAACCILAWPPHGLPRPAPWPSPPDLQLAGQLQHASSGRDDQATMRPALLHLGGSERERERGSRAINRQPMMGLSEPSREPRAPIPGMYRLAYLGKQCHEEVSILVPRSCEVLDQGDAARQHCHVTRTCPVDCAHMAMIPSYL